MMARKSQWLADASLKILSQELPLCLSKLNKMPQEVPFVFGCIKFLSLFG